jgi:hypothetical protein
MTAGGHYTRRLSRVINTDYDRDLPISRSADLKLTGNNGDSGGHDVVQADDPALARVVQVHACSRDPCNTGVLGSSPLAATHPFTSHNGSSGNLQWSS